MERCLAAAETVLSTAPVLGNYYLGAGQGFRSRVRAHQGRLRDALADAKQAVIHIKRAADADPGFEDAYLGLGMYHYFVSRLPAAVKPLAYFATGMWPSRKKGLEQIARTAEKGTLARVEAKSVLAAIYSSQREQRWGEADAILSGLMSRYPRNPYFRLRRVYVAQRLGRWEDALRLADPDGAWIAALSQEIRATTLAAARYRAAESLLLAGKPEAARAYLDSLEQGRCPPGLRDWVALRRGNLLQSEGAGERAAQAYRSIADGHAKSLAEKFLRDPYPGGPKTVSYMRWPLSEVPR